MHEASDVALSLTEKNIEADELRIQCYRSWILPFKRHIHKVFYRSLKKLAKEDSESK